MTDVIFEAAETAQQPQAPPHPLPPIEVATMRVGQCVRQGDVLVMRVAALPGEAERRDRRDLAVGVRHSHVACSPAITYSVAGKETLWIDSAARWMLDHDEHAQMVLPAGVYASWTQREAIVRTPEEIQEERRARYQRVRD